MGNNSADTSGMKQQIGVNMKRIRRTKRPIALAELLKFYLRRKSPTVCFYKKGGEDFRFEEFILKKKNIQNLQL